MNCTCIKDIEDRLKDHVSAKVKNVESVTCRNIAFVIGENLETALFIPFGIKADHPGYRSQKGKEQGIRANYCPFCGKPTKPAKEAANAPEPAHA